MVQELKNATKKVNLIYLHYRIISRIITTNKYLNTIKISPRDACTFCSQTTETISHLFWECPATQVFIQSIDRELYSKYKIHFKHNIQSWFFLQETNELQTLLITLAKAVIYSARNAEEKPQLSHMLKLLKRHAQEERYASIINNKEDVFNSKWKTLKNIIAQS